MLIFRYSLTSGGKEQEKKKKKGYLHLSPGFFGSKAVLISKGNAMGVIGLSVSDSYWTFRAKSAFRSSELRMSFMGKSKSVSATHNKSRSTMLIETRMNLLIHVAQRWEQFSQFCLSSYLFSPMIPAWLQKKYLQGFISWTSDDVKILK